MNADVIFLFLVEETHSFIRSVLQADKNNSAERIEAIISLDVCTRQ